MPYAVDNDWFRSRAEAAAVGRDSLRAELGLAPGQPVILYAAKFIARKKPDDLIEAYAAIARDPALRAPALVFVGDGEMRPALEARAKALGLGGVRFAGFRNQSALPAFYDLCDVFVLPSRLEPWGLVINEVMNAGRAVIASDEVGAAIDLVQDGENGFVFPAGDVAALADRLRRTLQDPALCRRMGERSRAIIGRWGFAEDVDGLKRALDHFVPPVRHGRR
jgi:glycosyltransferase involved in cell wall biosynthesis